MLKALMVWLFGLLLLIATFLVPVALVICGVWAAWHYGGWIAAIIAFFLLSAIANLLSKVLIAQWRMYKALVNLKTGTELYSEDPDKR